MESVLRSCLAFGLALLLTLGAGRLTAAQTAPASVPPVPPTAWLHEGTQLYETRQYQAAAAVWQRATQTVTDPIARAVAWSNLALTVYQLGDWPRAEAAIAASLQLLAPHPPAQTYAQALDIRGHLRLAQGQVQTALDDWETAAALYQQGGDRASWQINQLSQAQALQMLGLLPKAEQVLTRLQAAVNQEPNPLLQVRTRRSLGQVYTKLGQLDAAKTVLEASQQAAQQLPPAQQAAERSLTWLSLGNQQRAVAERDRALAPTAAEFEANLCKVYQPAQVDAALAGSPASPTPAQQAETALTFYQQAIQSLKKPEIPSEVTALTTLQAELNQFNLRRELQQEAAALQQLPTLQTQLAQLPPSRSSVFAQINLARSLMCFTHPPAAPVITQTLTTAIQQAQRLKDDRATAYGLGTLGHWHELAAQAALTQKPSHPGQADWQQARQLTQAALMLAQATHAADISYQWQWQLGRILRALPGEDHRQQAIAAYTAAVKTLAVVRNELIGTNPEMQFSFRDHAEPVYRELVDLLLNPPPNSAANANDPNQPDPTALTQAIQIIDSLQVAELENFFRCVLSQLVPIDKVANQADPSAAIFYPIILADRLEVIVNLPGQATPIAYTTRVPKRQVEATLQTLRAGMVNPAAGRDEYESASQQVYDWLIRPAAAALKTAQVKTLVFVLDGALRNIPMAALWDGQQFLLENYAVALTPGFQLLGPKRLEPRQLKALIGGLTTTEVGKVRIAGRNYSFEPLQNVQAETQKIKAVLPSSTTLVGQQFQPAILHQQLSKTAFPIVHLSTHGNFSANPQETFIVTSANGHINLDELQELLRAGKQNRPDAIELLVLSACETAKGDRHATLGMAGAAVRSGASSTLATLWAVDEASTTDLMGQFYQNLKQVIEQRQGTKAEALRQAQLTLLRSDRYDHPYYWSPFILLGNWL
jgi:CHAT domain-containing protein/tetratricopeptide (TPR) repeat protein